MHINDKTPLVFVDLETTGTSPKHHRVIEVGIVRVEDGVVVKEYKSLVNPGTLVPAFVTSLTGISTGMLLEAPSFDEIALEVQELLEGGLFIAHNAPFDYGFLGAEFKALGIDFSYPYLCTAKLSRSLYPRCRRHNLDSIIERYDLSAGDRHRALDDARVLHQFLDVAKTGHGKEQVYEVMQEMVRVRHLPQHVKEHQITKLPDTPGVYFFYGKDGELLYVGKSRRIRTRVRSHFAKDGLTGKGRDMLSEIRRIDYQGTAGDVGALILESHLIKKLSPIYNVRSRTRKALYVVREDINEDGYAVLSHSYADTIEKCDDRNVVAISRTKKQAKELLSQIAEQHALCPHLLDIEDNAPCFAHQLEQCNGACVGKEKHRHYNRRFREAFEEHRLKAWPFTGPVGIEERSPDGTGELFLIDNWRVLAALHFEDGEWQEFIPTDFRFDYDVYKIFARELLRKRPRLTVRELSSREEAWIRGEEGITLE